MLTTILVLFSLLMLVVAIGAIMASKEDRNEIINLREQLDRKEKQISRLERENRLLQSVSNPKPEAEKQAVSFVNSVVNSARPKAKAVSTPVKPSPTPSRQSVQIRRSGGSSYHSNDTFAYDTYSSPSYDSGGSSNSCSSSSSSYDSGSSGGDSGGGSCD